MNRSLAALVILVLVVVAAVAVLAVPRGTQTSSSSSSSTLTTSTMPQSTSSNYTTSTLAKSPSSPSVCQTLTPAETDADLKALDSNATGAQYDAQYWLYLGQNYTKMTFNAVANLQTDGLGYGSGQLVNGYTPEGYWYQVGLVWNWGLYDGSGHLDGFYATFEVWNSSSDSVVFPQTGEGTSLIPLREVAPGDNVSLSLSFLSGQVEMMVRDTVTGETAVQNYTSFGADEFVATPSGSGYPTSLLTEWPRVEPYVCPNVGSVFTSPQSSITGGYLRFFEWNFTGEASSTPLLVFENGKPVPSPPSEPFSLGSRSQSFYFDYGGFDMFVTEDSFTTP